ncbi:MAG: hypothetical protein ACT4PY_02610 [Armatimonadota bacterium]
MKILVVAALIMSGELAQAADSASLAGPAPIIVQAIPNTRVRALRPRARDSTVKVAVANVKSPADIGYDLKRNRVLIPLFKENKVHIRALT